MAGTDVFTERGPNFINHKDYMYDMIHADDFFEQIDDFINICCLVRSAYRNVQKKKKAFHYLF